MTNLSELPLKLCGAKSHHRNHYWYENGETTWCSGSGVSPFEGDDAPILSVETSSSFCDCDPAEYCDICMPSEEAEDFVERMRDGEVVEEIKGPTYSEETKPTNPKDILGVMKLPMHLVSPAMKMFTCIGKLNGALKYGRTNWRKEGVLASVYHDAIVRHLDDWMEGYDLDPDDKVHNLAAAAAGLDILIDSLVTGNLRDDRNFNGRGYWVARDMMTSEVKRLRELHAGRSPKHWTIADNNVLE